MSDWTVSAILMVLLLLPVLAWVAAYRQPNFSAFLTVGSHFEAEILSIDHREPEASASTMTVSSNTASSAAHAVMDGSVDSVLMIRQACLAMESVAQRRGVDLLRPFHISVPPLMVERGPLLSLLKAMLQNSLEATPKGGAVICSVRLMPLAIHFVVSDSSGYAEDGAVMLSDNGWRAETIRSYKLVAEALGGRLTLVEHPGEGVVMDLAFDRADIDAVTPQEHLALWSQIAGNDHANQSGSAAKKAPRVTRRPARKTADTPSHGIMPAQFANNLF